MNLKQCHFNCVCPRTFGYIVVFTELEGLKIHVIVNDSVTHFEHLSNQQNESKLNPVSHWDIEHLENIDMLD